MELLFNYKKKFSLKSLNTQGFFVNNFTRTQEPVSSYIEYDCFYPGIFMFGIDSVISSLLEKQI